MTTNKPFAPAAVYQAIAALAVILTVVFAVTTYWIKLDLQKKRRTVAEEQYGKVVNARDLHGPVVVDLVVDSIVIGFLLYGFGFYHPSPNSGTVGYVCFLNYAIILFGLLVCQKWRTVTFGAPVMVAAEPALRPEIVFASVFAWFASGALALYAFQTSRHASFDYYGPMRVVGYDVNIVRDDDYEKLVYEYNSDGRCEVVQIDLKVAFGGSWACPDHTDSDLECINTAKDQAFNCQVCGGLYNVSNAAEAASGYCVQSLIGDETPALLDAGARYDASVSPEVDGTGWKYVNAYGDCNSCSVQSDISGSYMGRAQALGIFSLFFFAVSGILLLWVWHQKRGKQRDVGVDKLGTESTIELLSPEGEHSPLRPYSATGADLRPPSPSRYS
jgi:hypothetical protein